MGTEAPPVQPMQSAAFPIGVRALCALMMIVLAGYGLRLLPRLLHASWPGSGVALFAVALLIVLWIGFWILRSRTQLDGDDLHQSWLWPKHVRAADVASVKLVDMPGLRQIVTPRLLVRRRGGGMTWFHSADPQLLRTFCAQVAKADLFNAPNLPSLQAREGARITRPRRGSRRS
ncbi:MAG: hypothetical protein LBE78_12485 [Burkholderiaceae bacterium]|jgi:hypothetical protein|nr:hypothetical protein [Burkholderiaceae bacterium]